jgi:5-methylcytosine-specific restriction protein A
MPKLCKCGKIVDRRCFDCYPTQHKQTTKERGYGHDWKQLSQRKRKLDPLCEECQRHGIVTPAEHVHHIVPIAEAPHLRLEWSNLMSVCHSCHDKLEPGHTRSYLRYKQG